MWRFALPLTIVVTLLGAACDGETTVTGAPLGWGPASGTLYTPPVSGSGIVGDWVFCSDVACATLTSHGLHFRADGTWSTLYQTNYGGSGPATYCVDPTPGEYSWDGSTLTLVGERVGGTLWCRVTLASSSAVVDCGLDQPLVMTRIDAGDVGSCRAPTSVDAGY